MSLSSLSSSNLIASLDAMDATLEGVKARIVSYQGQILSPIGEQMLAADRQQYFNLLRDRSLIELELATR